jgi:PAS domain S-box-containing protein
MKNLFTHQKADTPESGSNNSSNDSTSENSLNHAENTPNDFNETLLSSLPYPAMYISRKDRVILAANKIALEYGAKVGGHCWREFGKTEFISEKDKEIIQKYPELVPEKFDIKCSFCRSSECFSDSPCQNNPELKAFGKIWDAYWIKVSSDVFLHYLIDVTEQKKLEESLRENELFLKQTQQIAMLGSYSLDILTGEWVCSEVMDNIMGIQASYTKTIESWVAIIHPEWQEIMAEYFANEVIGNKGRFDKDYKIIRQNDKAVRWVHGLGDLKFDEAGKPIKMIGTIRDITELKEAEEERKLLFAAVENSDNRIVVKDLNLRIIAANKAWIATRNETSIKNLLGKTDAEILGVSPDNDPIHTDMENDRKAQKLAPGEFIQSEISMKLMDGKERIAIVKKFPIFDEKGNVFCTGSASTDITERKLMEEALRESELFLKQTQQIAMLGTFTLDISSGKWSSSEVLDTIFGIDDEYKKTFENWIKIVHPEWRKTLSDFFMLEMIGIKTKFDKEYKIIRQNDHVERWVHGIGSLEYNDKNEPVKMIGTIRDITERKQAEEERKFLLAAIEYTDSIVTVKDLNLRIVAANPAFVNAMGLSSNKSMIGKTDAELFEVSPDTEPVKSYMDDERKAQKLLPGESILKEEPLVLPNGRIQTMLTRKFPIFDAEGKLFCTGNVSTDITERKKAEEALWLKNICFDSSLTANSMSGPDGLITDVNKSFLDIYGYQSKQDVIGKPIYHFFKDAIAAKAIISSLNNYGQWEGDFIAKRGDESTFDAHALTTILTDKDGKMIGYQSSVIDITFRKKAEEALRKNEQMLLAILDHFPGVVFWKDKKSTYMGCNQAFAIGAGLKSSSEIVGKTDFDLPWSKIEAENYRADDFEVIEKGITKLHIVETQHQAEGKVTWFDTSKIPIRENGGDIIGVIGVSNDITDRKMAEDALIESEQKYRTIANFTDDWEYWLDPGDKFIYCSPSCKKITGYSSSEFIQNPEMMDKIIFPEDLPAYQKHRQERLVKFHNTELQFRIIHLNGEIRWIGHVCQPVYNDSGIYIGIRGSNRDITERKKTEEKLKNSERKYKLISLNITDGIFISKDGKIEYANPSMSQIFGYEESELERLHLNELIIPERRDDFEAFISFDPSSDQVNNIEIECLRKDNSIVFMEIFLNHVASEMLTYGVMHDITKKKQLQEKSIVKAIIQTEEKERANFSKELHDGLGPLLSTIKLYLQWSIRPNSNRSRKEIIFKAEEILEEALTAVKEISNKLSPHLLTNYGLTSAVQSFINKLGETNAVKIDFQSNVLRRIEIEIEVALYRAVIECINNTIKYAKAKHIHIHLIDLGNHILLQYMDDGKGFDIIKILSEKKGLGLYNLQNRIQTIGGEIKMFSNLHEGVNYHINVPVKPLFQNNNSDKF